MEEQQIEESITELLEGWVQGHNRTHEYDQGVGTTMFSRSKKRLLVTHEFVEISGSDGPIGGTSVCATFNGNKVFDSVNNRVELLVEGTWLNIVRHKS
jgi:hypothetical protein